MSIEKVYITLCDICGYCERAKAVSGRYNETEWTMPDTWTKGHSQNVHICPKCNKLLSAKPNPNNGPLFRG